MTQLDHYFLQKRNEFPMLNQEIRNQKLVYFDSAATSQKPQCVIDSLVDYYTKINSNVHRGDHYLSQKSTDYYEEARIRTAKLLGTTSNHIIFNAGATMGMNQVAYGLKHIFEKGDEIIITEMEHHSNMLVWLELAKELNLIVKIIPITKEFELDYKKAEELITKKTKLIAYSHMSNVLGTINDVKRISQIARSVNALTLVDGCQGIVHTQVDVNELDCDFYVFSAHKLYGPTGVGVLYAKNTEILKPMFYGGGQIQTVILDGTSQENSNISYLNGPARLESGTPNIADIIGFSAALEYLEEIDQKKIEQYDNELGKYFLEKINELGDDFKLYGKSIMENRGNVFSFRYLDKHPSDISTFLDQFGIATRGGFHCAEPLHKILNANGTVRISFCFYNTKQEIDYFIECMKNIKEMF